MSLIRRWSWVCDGCGREVVPPPEEQAVREGDVLMPEGWIHSMMGDDLCGWCQS